MAGANYNISHLHLFLTVKRGTKKSDVRRELQEKFECDAKEYFELLREPKKDPKIKCLADSNDGSSPSTSASSVLPFPGGGVLACDNEKYTGPNPMKVEEDKEGYESGFRATGTLTMFCFKGEHHYALTCCHVGSINDGDSLLDPKQRFQRDNNEYSAKIKTYRFKEKEENNNEAMSCDESDDDRTNSVSLGDFHMCRWDSECDILSLKIPEQTEVNCEIADVTPPDWNSLWDEILENTESISAKPLNVEKIGFKSALTHGHIAVYNASYKGLFKNAIAVKACDDRPFLEGGDSGALVFFRDRNGMKKAFAYGVYEVDKLNLPWANGIDGNSVSQNVENSPSISSEESEDDEYMDVDQEKSDDESEYEDDEDTVRDESDHESECEDDEDTVRDESDHESECEDDEDTDGDESDDESECGDKEDDDGVVFTDTLKGQYFICFRLDTALKKLNLKEAACVNACARCGNI